MGSPPHREVERNFRALLGDGGRILCTRARADSTQSEDNKQGRSEERFTEAE